jgi:hypothetical protein
MGAAGYALEAMFEFTFESTVVRWEGKAAWHFLLLPSDLSHEITRLCGDMKGGWGSLPVDVRIGATAWKTSIFPSKGNDAYLLPLKAAVRKAEDLSEGDTVEIQLNV